MLAPLICAPAAMADVAASDADIATMIKVLEARGCVVHDKNDASVLEDTRMTSKRAYATVSVLLQDGRAVIVNNELHLKTGACK
jgi:hypothetical protein